MSSERDYLILTNNPLAARCMDGRFTIRLEEALGYREILVLARDMVYEGHTLYTHPLSGSVKPNETPYKSVVVSKVPHGFSAEQAEIMGNAILAYDKFVQRNVVLTDQIRRDFQLIDYTLLSGALNFDAAAGLSKFAQP
ncbi:GrdX family protein [Oscillibacter sp. MSJ-2]|uniref:GrdX family protein n=1 Tax=Dysosmobacter acutus TaxID=2841504 RepID=A0ABS6F7G0_9FIRM|nr:GrdX family protein [Dysosmobacter acutus]MBU5626219.1 GrdX family protein [Dysosmobacter acutus]